MSKEDVMWALEAMVSELPKEKRTQAAGALRTIKTLLEVKGEEG